MADHKITIQLTENLNQLCAITRNRNWNYAEAAVPFFQKNPHNCAHAFCMF